VLDVGFVGETPTSNREDNAPNIDEEGALTAGILFSGKLIGALFTNVFS
jgi:hypothetical protein